MSTTYGPQTATRADTARASMRTAAVNADRTATAADRETAAEAEMAAYESYWHAHGVPAYAETSACQGLVREHAARGHTGSAPQKPSAGISRRVHERRARRHGPPRARAGPLRARTQPPARRSGGNHDRT